MITYTWLRSEYFSIVSSKTCRSTLLCPQNATAHRFCLISYRLCSENSLIFHPFTNSLFRFFKNLNENLRNLANFRRLPLSFECLMCEISSENSPHFLGISIKCDHIIQTKTYEMGVAEEEFLEPPKDVINN